MSKHTPGPWTAIAADCDPLPSQVPLAELDDWRIVTESREYPGPLEQMANADLMAAAPKLLKACKRFLEAAKAGDEEKLDRALRLAQDAVLEAAHVLYLLPRKEQPLSDPMHQLAHGFPVPPPATLSDLESAIRARHEAGECGMLPCPECKAEAEAQEALRVYQGRPRRRPLSSFLDERE